MFQEVSRLIAGTTAAVATSAGVRRSSNTDVRSARPNGGEDGQISPPTTVRAARGCRSPPAYHLRLSGKLEKRYCSHQFGSHRGNPATVVYADRYHLPEEPCWLHRNR